MTEAYAIRPVARDVWGITIPRPGGGVSSRVYVLRCEGGHVLVDAGWDTPDGIDALSAALASVGASLDSVVGVAMTHLHVDHCGLAPAIRSITGAWVAAHPAEIESSLYRHGEGAAFMADLEPWLRQAGVPEPDAAEMFAAREVWNARAPIFAVDRMVADGDVLPVPGWSLKALYTPGHAPGHLCFVDAERSLVVGGDLILEGRVPPVWSYDFGEAGDPIGDFLTSLDRVEQLGAVTILPGHGEPFDDVASEVERLRAHHVRRMTWLAGRIGASPATVWEAAVDAPWSRPWAELPVLARLLALGKISAHLVALTRRGEALQVEDAPIRFEATAPGAVVQPVLRPVGAEQ